jgi:hypothetical protein
VDGGQGTGARTLLLLRGTAAVGALGTGQDASRGQDEDVTVGELLLELAGQALLDLVEAGEERNRDEDNNGALVVADLELERCLSVFVLFLLLRWFLVLPYLAGRGELQRSQRGLEIWDVLLEFVEGGGDILLQLGGISPRRAVSRNLVESGLRHDCD